MPPPQQHSLGKYTSQLRTNNPFDSRYLPPFLLHFPAFPCPSVTGSESPEEDVSKQAQEEGSAQEEGGEEGEEETDGEEEEGEEGEDEEEEESDEERGGRGEGEAEEDSEEEEEEESEEEGEGDEASEGQEDFFQILERQVQWRPQMVVPSRAKGAKGRYPAPFPSHFTEGRIQTKPGKAGVPQLRVLPSQPTNPSQKGPDASALGLSQGKGQGQEQTKARPGAGKGWVVQGSKSSGGVSKALVQAAAARGVGLEKQLLVPPTDARLVARAARKSAPQTAGPKWYATGSLPGVVQDDAGS